MKKIAVLTATRAEYGLLKPLINKLKNDKEIDFKLIVTGMHLLPKYGNTFQEIEGDGFHIDYKLFHEQDRDSSSDVVKSNARIMIEASKLFEVYKPDFLLVLGDRTEILSVAFAAIISQIKIVHLCGGEITEGAYDNAVRHSLTKMSHLHFATTEVYRKRIIQMGESADTVFNVGSTSVDNIKYLKLMSLFELESYFGLNLSSGALLVTYHPETLSLYKEDEFDELLKALDHLSDNVIIFTKPNSDVGSDYISKKIDEFVLSNPSSRRAYSSLGSLRYLSLLQFVKVVIGNSSSGITEVPYFYKPTVNIGKRQQGRIFAKSIINCNAVKNEIIDSIIKANSAEFLAEIQNQELPFGNGNAAEKIIEILKLVNNLNLQKKFVDVN